VLLALGDRGLAGGDVLLLSFDLGLPAKELLLLSKSQRAESCRLSRLVMM
jgi:hypothetical protein